MTIRDPKVTVTYDEHTDLYTTHCAEHGPVGKSYLAYQDAKDIAQAHSNRHAELAATITIDLDQPHTITATACGGTRYLTVIDDQGQQVVIQGSAVKFEEVADKAGVCAAPAPSPHADKDYSRHHLGLAYDALAACADTDQAEMVPAEADEIADLADSTRVG